MADAAFYVPVTLGRDKNSTQATLVKDYAGDLGEYSDDSIKWITTDIAEGCVSWVDPQELINARKNGPELPTFGVTQLLIDNGFIDQTASETQTYKWNVDDHITLYVVITAARNSREGLDSRLRSFYQSGSAVPPALMNHNLDGCETIIAPLHKLKAPLVAVRTQEDVDRDRRESSRGHFLQGLVAAGAAFFIVFSFNIITHQINKADLAKQADLKTEHTNLLAEKNRLLALKAPPRLEHDQIILKLTESYLISSEMSTGSNVDTPEYFSLDGNNLAVRFPATIGKGVEEFLLWEDDATVVINGDYVVSFNPLTKIHGGSK